MKLDQFRSWLVNSGKSQLTAEQYANRVGRLLDGGQQRGQPFEPTALKPGTSPGTISNYRSAWNSWLAYLADEEGLTADEECARASLIFERALPGPQASAATRLHRRAVLTLKRDENASWEAISANLMHAPEKDRRALSAYLDHWPLLQDAHTRHGFVALPDIERNGADDPLLALAVQALDRGGFSWREMWCLDWGSPLVQCHTVGALGGLLIGTVEIPAAAAAELARRAWPSDPWKGFTAPQKGGPVLVDSEGLRLTPDVWDSLVRARVDPRLGMRPPDWFRATVMHRTLEVPDVEVPEIPEGASWNPKLVLGATTDAD